MPSTTDYRRLLKHSIRLYFAPLTGAYKGIFREYRLIHADARHAGQGKHASPEVGRN